MCGKRQLRSEKYAGKKESFKKVVFSLRDGKRVNSVRNGTSARKLGTRRRKRRGKMRRRRRRR